jgi:hypothetical protein
VVKRRGRKTRAWKYVAQEAKRMAALHCSPAEIAAHIGVDKSTVTRWIARGLLKVGSNVIDVSTIVRAKKSPAEWAQAIRDEFDLSDTDDQLVTLGEAALMISQDAQAKRSERLNASRTFLSIETKLGLAARRAPSAEQEREQHEAAAAAAVASKAASKNPPVRRPSNADPRMSFMRVVK